MPFVYDDHEYRPLQARLLKEIGNLPALNKPKAIQPVFDLPKRIRCLWTKWESEVSSSHPTISVSANIAEEKDESW